MDKKENFFPVADSRIKSFYVEIFLNPLFTYFCRPSNFRSNIQEYVMKRAFKTVQSCIDLKNYDILHFHQILPYSLIGLFAKKEFGNILVLSVHGHGIHTYPSESLEYANSTVCVLKQVDHVIFVSEYLKTKAFNLGYDLSNFSIINNGFNSQTFKKMNKLEVCKRLNLPSNKIYLGYIGVLSDIKGADRLINIYKILFDKFWDKICFVVIGEGPFVKQIENLAEKIPLIHLKSVNYEQVPIWLNLFDIFLLPSKEEGFSCIALESLACGTRLVGSKIPGIGEVVGSNGGILIERDDNFDANVVDVISNIVVGGIPPFSNDAKFLEEHSWNNIVRKEIEIYKKLLSKHSIRKK